MRRPVLPRQQYALFSPQGYLERARWWLTSKEDASILYASLELRYAFETIVVKHAWASGITTKTFEKLHDNPKDLFATLRKEFAPKIDIDKSYRFFHEGTDKGAELVAKSLDQDGTLTHGYFLTSLKGYSAYTASSMKTCTVLGPVATLGSRNDPGTQRNMSF
jgi:hypothetical protein